MKAETEGPPWYESLPRIGVKGPNGSKPYVEIRDLGFGKVQRVQSVRSVQHVLKVFKDGGQNSSIGN